MSLLMVLALAAGTATATAANPAQATTTTLQQDFDTASAASAAGDCVKAVPLFEALERRPTLKAGSLAASAIGVRKGVCLVQLSRLAEGESAILAGLPGLERAGKDFASDVAEAYLALGKLSLSRSDFRQARERLEVARAQQVEPLRAMILASLIRATMFDAGAEPLALADEGLRIASSMPQDPKSTSSKDRLAAFHTFKARTLLNRGENEAAYAELKEALKLSGGLTQRTTLGEASMRGDLALAALLLGRKDEARKYLAYTGSGRIEVSPFATAVSMAPPECGEETGLRPDDFAVVEFGIASDGSVSDAQTVYSRGGPAVAAAFAQSVNQWFWRPEAIAKIPEFYRLATRVELRCSAAGGPAPGLMKPLSDRFAVWAYSRLQWSASDVSASSTWIDALRRELASRERTQDIPGQIAAVGLLALADPRVNAQTVTALDRAISAGKAAQLSAEVINALRIYRLLAQPYSDPKRVNSRNDKSGRRDALVLLQDPAIAADALAEDTLRLMSTTEGDDLTQKVADDGRLAEHHSLRQLALLTLANRAAGKGDLASAQAFFARTGLTEQQCALIGARPALRRTGADSSDFPAEAMMYGFEGWVNLEFDIAADGGTANARPIIAYPPFVFVDAAKGMTRDIRYEASYRPSGGVACNANRETIRFILP